MPDPTAIEAEILEIAPRPTAAVRIQQPMAALDLASAYDRYLPLVAARVREAGGELAGPPFGRYHRFGPDIVDVELGFPVAAPPTALPPLAESPQGEVGRSELPGGTVAKAIHRGAYDGLPGTWDALHEWIHEQPGVDDGEGAWESYVDDPSATTDPSTIRTEVFWPLVRT